ncbi:MAG: zinc ribbon domain-containing protein [bacterium]
MTRQKGIEKQYQEIPERRQEIQSILEKIERDIQTTQEQLKHHELEQRAMELELRQGQEARVKKESLINTLKTPKEYQATQTEIETLDKKNSRLEEKLIQLLDSIEQDKKTLEARQKELEEKRPGFEKELSELTEREQALNASVEAAQEETKSVAGKLGNDLYRRFERVFLNRGGIAISPANSGHCGVCNIRLTPRLIQLAKRGQDIVTCEGCSRFLYWDHSQDEDEFRAL